MIAVGDIHGCYDSLMRLRDILPHDDLCFCGDLEDRGDKSKDVIEFVKSNNYKCVMGNHEEFMILSYNDNREKHYITSEMWYQNGGLKTIESYQNDEELFFEHRAWMKKLPIVIWANKNTVISHSRYLPCHGFPLSDKVKENILWSRCKSKDHHTNGILNIHGHSICYDVKMEYNYLNIDTGCHKNGLLTAYDIDTGVIYQYNRNTNGYNEFKIDLKGLVSD